ncbi:MAG: hypothetical protein IKL52_07625, partial [Candidatus Gastranaerophilales bacterium]|nr:hypothetical protein [Candidatus Gastranaerophilales bacterium]
MGLFNVNLTIINDGGSGCTPKKIDLPDKDVVKEENYEVINATTGESEGTIGICTVEMLPAHGLEYDTDNDGNIEKLQKFYMQDDIAHLYEEIFDSDDNGIKEKEVGYKDDGSKDWERFYDNKTGNELRHIEYLDNGEINYQEDFTYNDSGLLIKEVQTDGDGTIQSETNYTYNEDGTFDVVTKSNDGKHDWTHHYDENGNEVSRTFSTIDENGNKIITTWDYVNDTKVTQTFDSKGNLIENNFEAKEPSDVDVQEQVSDVVIDAVTDVV